MPRNPDQQTHLTPRRTAAHRATAAGATAGLSKLAGNRCASRGSAAPLRGKALCFSVISVTSVVKSVLFRSARKTLHHRAHREHREGKAGCSSLCCSVSLCLCGEICSVCSSLSAEQAAKPQVTGRRWRVMVWCFALLGALAGPLWAQTPAPGTAEAYVQQFQASYRQVRSLSADFTQTYTFGSRTRVEAGTVDFARGGLMRWDYQRPTPKLFISNGKQVFFYVPEEHQLTRSSVKSSEDFRVPFELLLTRLDLHRYFARVELADAALAHAPGDHVLRAFPKKEFAGDYTDVLIELDPEFNIRQLVTTDAEHRRMAFTFDHILRNPPLARSLFEFTPPPGTEIIEEK